MKKLILSLICLLAIAISSNAQLGAPSYSPVTVINDVIVAAQSATNLFNNATFFCGKQNTVAFGLSASNTVDMDTSGAINGIMFVRSVDNVNYETNGTYVTWVPVGKSWKNTVTNINTYGAGWIKILFATNAAASGGNTTNVGSLHVTAGVKLSAP